MTPKWALRWGTPSWETMKRLVQLPCAGSVKHLTCTIFLYLCSLNLWFDVKSTGNNNSEIWGESQIFSEGNWVHRDSYKVRGSLHLSAHHQDNNNNSGKKDEKDLFLLISVINCPKWWMDVLLILRMHVNCIFVVTMKKISLPCMTTVPLSPSLSSMNLDSRSK